MSFDNNTMETHEKKKQKIELNYHVAYITKSNKLIIKNNYTNIYEDKVMNDDDDIILHSGNHPIQLFVLHIQIVEGANVYLILDIGDETKSLKEIFEKFMNGNLTIGVEQHYNNNNGYIIYNGTINDEVNSDIKLHYTQLMSYEGNDAWRTINWDLFEEFVPE